MNKHQLLNWILLDTEDLANQIYNMEEIKKVELSNWLFDLNNRRETILPANLPKTPAKMIPVLRNHFTDRVTLISLVLNHYFPEQYLFYRVSPLEQEIFAGLEFFSEIVPEFASLRFRNVGRTGFQRYETLNRTLFAFSKTHWPDLKKPQAHLSYFLYQGLGKLFIELDQHRRYWVMATTEDYFETLDENDLVEWSGRKDMQSGDYVFMYRTAPRSAITGLYQVVQEPLFDPWAGWQGFWIEMKRVCSIPDISFTMMKSDPVLGEWGTVRKNFTGTVTEPVPIAIYNRLLDFVPKTDKQKRQLEPEKVIKGVKLSGKFKSEAEFEKEIIRPLLRQWNVRSRAQHPCQVRIGGQAHTGWIDFFVSDDQGPLTLFEDKLRVINDKDLARAVEQAKSYALHLGLPSFVVAAPEGFWLYAIEKNVERLVKKYPPPGKTNFGEMKQRLLSLRR